MSDNNLVRASSVMAVGTIFSRITGLIRGLLVVALLGTAILGDTFNVANTMPNILFNLLVGGALTSVFMPQIVRSLRDSDGGNGFISKLFTISILLLLIITILGIIFSPNLVNLYAPEYAGRREFDVTVQLMRYCLPQIFFLGLYALLGQIANSKNIFGPMMWAPVLNNGVSIFLFWWLIVNRENLSLDNISDSDLMLIGLGTTFAYSLQAFILVPVVLKSGVGLKFVLGWKDKQLIKSLRLAIWGFIYAAISQLSYLVTVNLATSSAVKALDNGIEAGVGFTPYANAYLILLVPHSIISVSIVTAMLPRLSDFVIDKKIDSFSELITKSIKLVGVFTVPTSVFFLLFGTEITKSIFFGIGSADAEYLGLVLSAFAFGLIPVSINLVLLRGFNAFEDMKSQVLVNLIMNSVSVLFSYIVAATLKPQWVTIALAGIFTVHYFLGIFLSFILIKRHGISLQIFKLFTFHLKLFGISIVTIIPLWLLKSIFPSGNIFLLSLVMAISVVLYIGISRLLKVAEVTSLLKVIRPER
jgi:putative peptidoglycan lipid II flippase